MEKDPYQNLRGDNNPMCRPEVAAKQAASLRKTWSDPEKRKHLSKQALNRWSRPGEREKQSERMRQASGQPTKARPGKKWSAEDKQRQSEKMKAYWAKVKSALVLLDNEQHADTNATK